MLGIFLKRIQFNSISFNLISFSTFIKLLNQNKQEIFSKIKIQFVNNRQTHIKTITYALSLLIYQFSKKYLKSLKSMIYLFTRNLMISLNDTNQLIFFFRKKSTKIRVIKPIKRFIHCKMENRMISFSYVVHTKKLPLFSVSALIRESFSSLII